MKKAIVIGSGFSSLSASCYLAKAGFKVMVLEKNEQIGGRASILEESGFRFDMGPSWYWMPDVFDRFFKDFGYQTSDFYSLKKLNPAYRVFFGKNDFIDIEDEPKKIINRFSTLDPSCAKPLTNFLKQAEENYKIAMNDLVYKPGISISELMTLETAKRLNLFIKSISKNASNISTNKKLQSILEFPVLFLGAKPKDTPAFYNFMNWADFGLGTWYPEEGIHSVVKAMTKIAKSLGVEFYLNQEVTKIECEKNRVTQVITKETAFDADVLISGADYAHTETLLEKENRNYPENYWNKKTFAPSSLLYYVGFKGKLKNVEHHNLFFDTDFKKHAEEIYDEKIFPENPLFYANFPSITDESLAPDSFSTAFFLIPTAVDLEDSEEIQEKYFELIINRLEEITGEVLKSKIVYRKNFGIKDFKNRYHSCKGNAYGLANTLMQTSVLRPSIQNKKINNLFYTGQLTVPGPGIPPALISGKIVSEYLIKNCKFN